MEHLSHLENRLGIDQNNYSFALNEHGHVNAIELYDGEYYEFQGYSGDIFEVLSHYPDLETIAIDTENYVVEDLSLLTSFKKLKVLELGYFCNFKDLNGLQELKCLEIISFQSGNGITDLSPLSNLKNLRRIIFHNSNITDLSPLASLSNMEAIELPSARISDVTPIRHLVNLKSLNLSDNQLEDITALGSLNGLISLFICENNITDITALQNLHELQTLNISNNHIRDASVLADKSNLRFLDFMNNKIADIEFLMGLHNIQALTISNNPITNYHPVKQLTGIRTLFSNGVTTNNISDIAFNSDILILHMDGCKLNDIQFLRTLTNLQTVNLNNNAISNVAVFSNCYSLRTVLLKNNNIAIPYSIFNHTGLQELDLRGNTFGNKHYVKHPGSSTLLGYDPDRLSEFTHLSAAVAKYHFDIGDYETALASYYYGKYIYETLEIYVRKFCSIPKEETFRLKFYFYKIIQLHSSVPDAGDNKKRDLMNDLYAKIETLQQGERIPFLHFLKTGLRFTSDFMQKHLQQLHKEPYHASLDGEIYYQLIAVPFNRRQIAEACYYFKILKKQGSPFADKLAVDIMACLQNKFANTREERAEHDKYMNMLLHPDEVDIPVPEYEEKADYENESFHIVNDDGYPSPFRYFLKAVWIVSFISIPVIILCTPNHKMAGIPILIMLMSFLGKKLFND